MFRRTYSAWYRVSCYLWGPTWKHHWGEGSLIQIYLTVNHVTCVTLSTAVQTQPYTVWHMKPLPHTLDMHCVWLLPWQGIVFCNPFTTASLHYTRAVFVVRTLLLLTCAGFTAEETCCHFEVLQQMKTELVLLNGLTKISALDMALLLCFQFIQCLCYLFCRCYMFPNTQIPVVLTLNVPLTFLPQVSHRCGPVRQPSSQTLHRVPLCCCLVLKTYLM